jgi:hypothetical protein
MIIKCWLDHETQPLSNECELPCACEDIVVCPENLKPLISLTFFEFLSMLEQRTPPSSHMVW